MWNLRGLAPESFRLPFVLAAFLALGAASACGPSNGGGTPAIYKIVFTLSDTEGNDKLTDLSFKVVYDGGDFTGSGTTVSCDLLDNGDAAVFTDNNIDTLTVVIDASETELEDDDDIVECDFVSSIQPTSNDFTITITAAEPSDIDEVSVVVTSTELSGASLAEEAE